MAIVVTRYNLAYINHSICNVDNGRVLGFDNAHDYHHTHYIGEVAARKADQAQAFDGKVTLSFEDPQRMCTVLSEARRRLMSEVRLSEELDLTALPVDPLHIGIRPLPCNLRHLFTVLERDYLIRIVLLNVLKIPAPVV